MVSGEVRFHEKSSEAYRQEMWHVREPSVFLEHSVSGGVGEESRSKKGQIVKNLENHVFQLGLDSATLINEIQNNKINLDRGSPELAWQFEVIRSLGFLPLYHP